VPVAYLVLRAGATASAVEIEGFCLQQLARYKVPREYVLVDSLPRNAMGKVLHYRLRELIAQGAAPAAAPAHNDLQGLSPGRWRWFSR
jgi:fatty-acyl-CoA synthase